MPISAKDVSAGISEEHRGYFLLQMGNLDDAYLPVIKALWEAIGEFSPFVRHLQPTIIILDVRPFTMVTPLRTLTWDPKPHVAHTCIEHMIFIDIAGMAKLKHAFMVTAFLEELVHAVMNIADEPLTKTIVTTIYPKVIFLNGQYRERPGMIISKRIV